MTSLRLTFITPLFSKGAYDNLPEIRPPSIRGQLHWWFRALGGSASDEKAIFGGVHGNPIASKIVVRVGAALGKTGEFKTLPHKYGGQASPKWAYGPGASFDLIISERLGGLGAHSVAFRRTLETWLLLGTLGLRSTRAAGSFTWEPQAEETLSPPKHFDEYSSRISNLLKEAPLKSVLLPKAFSSADEARLVVSDTIGGRDDSDGKDSLARLNHPLGKVFGGRKTSPLRFRVVRIASAYHIAAVWDDRSQVTGNRPEHRKGVVDLLVKKNKEIGRLLQGHF